MTNSTNFNAKNSTKSNSSNSANSTYSKYLTYRQKTNQHQIESVGGKADDGGKNYEG